MKEGLIAVLKLLGDHGLRLDAEKIGLYAADCGSKRGMKFIVFFVPIACGATNG